MNILISFLPSLAIGGAMVAVSRARADYDEFAAGISRVEALSYQWGFLAGSAAADREHFTAEEYLAALNYGQRRAMIDASLDAVLEQLDRMGGDENSAAGVLATGFDPDSLDDPHGARFFGWKHK